MRRFRTLKESEIECRIDEIARDGSFLRLLLYKTARTDAALLDETVGSGNWQNDYKLIDGKLFCGIGIREDSGWVWKWNVGIESRQEPEKGQASDAMKRAGFVWGIGTELYSAPEIKIYAGKCNIKMVKDKYRCYDTFSVERIAYDKEDDICGLAILCNGKRCFVWQATT